MYASMRCGTCDSEITMETDDDLTTVTLDLVHRFTRAHEDCGFMVPTITKEEELRKRLLQGTKAPKTE